MTDHHTYDLFKAGASPDQCVRAEVSRLVVDVERFVDDASEAMSARGMGAIYTMTSNQSPLRRTLTDAERQELLNRYYYPHHARLEALVDETLNRYGRCLVIDCHSFPSCPLPYELDQSPDRPDICIGTDEFHTPKALGDAFISAFEDRGFRVGLNVPFSGALVPIKHYRRDARVAAVMVEANRRLYINEETGMPLDTFDKVSSEVVSACKMASKSYQTMLTR